MTEQFQASPNLTPDPQFQASSKKVRGRNKKTLALIDAMYKIAEASKPITGRGIGYKLFATGLIDNMATKNMNAVYYALSLYKFLRCFIRLFALPA